MRQLLARPLAALLLIIVCSTAGFAQTRADLPPETIKKIEDLISTEMARQSLPGISVAVAVDNRLRYANGFGMADLENSIPARATTVYRTASIAKAMTAVAVMKLVEQGRLDLDAPIQKYCAAFPEKQWPVTARHLLGHLGGIRHYKSSEESNGTRHYFTIADSLALFKDEPLLHEPGTRFQYTTYGYSVLGCAIEGASGQPYDAFMRAQIFEPAAMHHSGIDHFRLLISNRARGYTRLNESAYAQLPEAAKRIAKVGGIYNATLHDTSMKVPGGGLVSTSIDLVKFAIAVNSSALVKPSSLEQMWTGQKARDGKATNYGLGWGISEVGGIRALNHSGGQAGTSTMLVLMPEKGVAVALMTNLDGVGLWNLAQQIATTLLAQDNQANK
ncbi:MAG TPA: serine hydrolase domain-containing protein [Blastocatellia bacterium]